MQNKHKTQKILKKYTKEVKRFEELKAQENLLLKKIKVSEGLLEKLKKDQIIELLILVIKSSKIQDLSSAELSQIKNSISLIKRFIKRSEISEVSEFLYMLISRKEYYRELEEFKRDLQVKINRNNLDEIWKYEANPKPCSFTWKYFIISCVIVALYWIIFAFVNLLFYSNPKTDIYCYYTIGTSLFMLTFTGRILYDITKAENSKIINIPYSEN